MHPKTAAILTFFRRRTLRRRAQPSRLRWAAKSNAIKRNLSAFYGLSGGIAWDDAMSSACYIRFIQYCMMIQYPVLTAYGAMTSGTDKAFTHAISLRACYAISSTELKESISQRACYAMSGTDIARGPTRLNLMQTARHRSETTETSKSWHIYEQFGVVFAPFYACRTENCAIFAVHAGVLRHLFASDGMSIFEMSMQFWPVSALEVLRFGLFPGSNADIQADIGQESESLQRLGHDIAQLKALWEMKLEWEGLWDGYKLGKV
eukprot:2907559-Rhodomonas_salina.2